MDLLPPELRSFDGHPLAPLAAKVIADLTKVGIPVHVVDESDDHSHVTGGIALRMSEEPAKELMLYWHVPDEDRYRAEEARERPEVTGAVATLSAAVVSVLLAFDHRVRTVYDDPAFPYPFIWIRPSKTA
ncbi:hypothetical protein [Streptomyces chrestomyceticus]|uniref:DUF2007 domain-containing protein n=1 Tax=Streptomyces chrestomyceticus TaxID=68185 RepID=A0ABU7X584_9ACTN